MRKLTLLRTAETERRKPEAKNADGTEPKDRTGKGKLEAAGGKWSGRRSCWTKRGR